MADQDDVQAPAVQGSGLPAEIGGSLASVWARYAGSRPAGAQVQLDGNVIRWTLANGTAALEAAITASSETDPPHDSPLTMSGYRRELAMVITRATRRKIMATISKQDAKTGVATETFILEVVPKKY